MNLTHHGLQKVEEIAGRYDISTDAAIVMLQAVINGGGTMAQFSHPELGGVGQWMQGGMTMVGDMFNNGLKAKVDNLCSELSPLAMDRSVFVQSAQSAIYEPGAHSDHNSLTVNIGSQQWWPSELGWPSSTGSQNDVRYAIFPAISRLVLEIKGNLTIYDTLNHQIGGVGQQQGFDSSVTFTSQFGLVRVSDLPVVSGYESVLACGQSISQSQSLPELAPDQTDVLLKIDRLAELRQKGVLSDVEFASKKAELMSRL